MSVHRSPTTCPKQALEELCCSFLTLFDHTNHIVVAGDLNIDLLSDSHMKLRMSMLGCWQIFCWYNTWMVQVVLQTVVQL